MRHQFTLTHNDCSFCDEDIETTEHLFFQCKFVKVFWDELQYCLASKLHKLPESDSVNLRQVSPFYCCIIMFRGFITFVTLRLLDHTEIFNECHILFYDLYVSYTHTYRQAHIQTKVG